VGGGGECDAAAGETRNDAVVSAGERRSRAPAPHAFVELPMS